MPSAIASLSARLRRLRKNSITRASEIHRGKRFTVRITPAAQADARSAGQCRKACSSRRDPISGTCHATTRANAIELRGRVSGNLHASASTLRSAPSITGTPHDRPLLLDHAERPQDHDVSRGDRAEIQDFSGQYRQGRTVQAGVFWAVAAEQPVIPAMVDHEPKGGTKPISIFESGRRC